MKQLPAEPVSRLTSSLPDHAHSKVCITLTQNRALVHTYTHSHRGARGAQEAGRQGGQQQQGQQEQQQQGVERKELEQQEQRDQLRHGDVHVHPLTSEQLEEEGVRRLSGEHEEALAPPPKGACSGVVLRSWQAGVEGAAAVLYCWDTGVLEVCGLWASWVAGSVRVWAVLGMWVVGSVMGF